MYRQWCALGKLCIEVTPESRIAFISESLCKSFRCHRAGSHISNMYAFHVGIGWSVLPVDQFGSLLTRAQRYLPQEVPILGDHHHVCPPPADSVHEQLSSVLTCARSNLPTNLETQVTHRYSANS